MARFRHPRINRTTMLAVFVVLAFVIVALHLAATLQFRIPPGNDPFSAKLHDFQKASPKQKRAINPVSDAQFRLASDKGNQFICWMKDPSSAGTKAVTQWTNPQSIPQWGWALGEAITSSPDTQIGLLKDLVSGSRDGLRWIYRHNLQHPNIGTTSYPPTGASYNNVYWPDKGVIVANSNYGPLYQIGEKRTPLQRSGYTWDPATMSPPQLRQLSDFWWLCWQAASQGYAPWISGIRHIVRRNVENQVTVDILAHVLKLNGWSQDGRPPTWPQKVVIESETNGFAALISTPNVYAACWFVIQHGAELAVKLTIKSITAYREPGNNDPTLVITLGEVSQ